MRYTCWGCLVMLLRGGWINSFHTPLPPEDRPCSVTLACGDKRRGLWDLAEAKPHHEFLVGKDAGSSIWQSARHTDAHPSQSWPPHGLLRLTRLTCLPNLPDLRNFCLSFTSRASTTKMCNLPIMVRVLQEAHRNFTVQSQNSCSR